MSISTPQSGDRHQVDTPDSVFLSPATRRQPVSLAGTPTLQNFTSNDDERERKQRRMSRVIDLQLSNADSPASTISPTHRGTDTPTSLLPKLNNTQISDHYSTCIKLSQENKITTKNAFGLHLIDYMGDILKQKDSELTNFKVAAGTLDASAKIYAVRVDAVHLDVYKVLGGLGKESQIPEESEHQDPDASTEGQDDKKKGKKRKRSYKTIEKNLNNINRSENDCKSEVDPLFQKSAASFDEFSTAGVFLSTLQCHNYHSELRFETDVKPLSTIEENDPPSPLSVDVSELKSPLSQCVEKRPICPSLSGFRFMQWDSDLQNETVSSLMDKFKKSDHVFDINAEVEEDCADAADPIADDFDADACDGMESGDLGEFSEHREAFRSERKGPQITQIGNGDIDTMCLQLSSCPGEYSYFSPRTMSMWAGPEHWRFRPRHKADSSTDKQKVKKVKKAFELNFDDDIDFDVHFCKTRAATTLTKSTLGSQNKKSTILPADFHYDPDNIVKLSLRPVDRIRKMVNKDSVSEHEDVIGEYDYNNPNDTADFCPALQAADSDDDDGPFTGPGDEYDFIPNTGLPEKPMNITSYSESNLVAEPQKVNKIEINYARTAKKMDMKRLKTTMWGLLTNCPDSAEERPSSNETEPAGVAQESVFSNITQHLQKRLPSVMAQNLSVPLAFACLLHLANEKNLKLQGVDDLSDVLIMQGD
ncbi:condensin complex subunit 2 [Pelobates fuscus]|uniref:condensin complex subunit 2 n=1 Tax=Pelobates fuscus TaxID=191477 RepID=UPI002FE455E9